MLLFADTLCMIISMLLSFEFRFGRLFGVIADWDQIEYALILFVVFLFSHISGDFYTNFYKRSFWGDMQSLLLSQILTVASWIVILYLGHTSSNLSRLVFGYFFIINFVLTVIAHLLIKHYLYSVYKNGSSSQRLIVVTSEKKAEKLIRNVLEGHDWDSKLIGIALVDTNEVECVNGVPVINRETDFMQYVVQAEVDEVFMDVGDYLDRETENEMIAALSSMGINVDVNIDIFDMNIQGSKKLSRVGSYAVVTFARNFFSTRQLLLKRILDIIGSLVGIVIFAIAFIFVAPAIMIESPGPIFFTQTRMGKNGRKFKLIKFRSMYADAEERKKKLMEQNEMNGLMFKMTDDPRITKIGKFIRKTSIDELPQFINILRGDMSLVGTRPPTLDEFEQYELKYKCRLSMKPGLTGMWQVSGRSDITNFDEVVKLDMEYIDDWTITKDIKILFQTVYVVLCGKGSK